MCKYAIVIFAIVACVTAKPGILHAPLAAAPVALAAPAPLAIAAPAPAITATSSQVVVRNHNGIAAAPVLAAAPAPVVATLATAAFAAPLPAHLRYAAPAASIFL